MVIARQVQAGAPVGGNIHHVALVRQTTLNNFQDCRVVFYDQDPLIHIRLCPKYTTIWLFCYRQEKINHNPSDRGQADTKYTKMKSAGLIPLVSFESVVLKVFSHKLLVECEHASPSPRLKTDL
jgi:hypothetical protein